MSNCPNLGQKSPTHFSNGTISTLSLTVSKRRIKRVLHTALKPLLPVLLLGQFSHHMLAHRVPISRWYRLISRRDRLIHNTSSRCLYLSSGFSNWRASTLGDTSMVCLLSVVCTNFRFHTVCNPLSRIKRPTLWRPIVMPLMCSAAHSLRLP